MNDKKNVYLILENGMDCVNNNKRISDCFDCGLVEMR